MPFDAGLVYDTSGNSFAGGGGAQFGGKWISGSLAGITGAGTASMTYSRGPGRSVEFNAPSASGVADAKYFTLQQLMIANSSSSSSPNSSSSCAPQAKYSILDPSGLTRMFDDNGRISAVAGKCGNYSSFQYNSTTGRIEKVLTSFDNGTNQYVYAWTGDKITGVTYFVNSRAVLKTVYGYSGNQLKTVKLYENTTSSNNPSDWGDPISCSLYTYHTDGRIRHVIPPTQYRQMVNNGILDPESAGESVLNSYASAEYEYLNGRVSRMYKNGRKYAHDFEYAFNYPSGTDLNQWTVRTTVTHSDGSKHFYYFNRIGQWMLHKVQEPSNVGTKVWYPLYQKFDASSGRLILTANDTAIASVSETNAWLAQLEPSKGLITEFSYNSTGRLESTGIRNGTSGSLVNQSLLEYETRTVTGKGTIYVAKSETVYSTAASASAIKTSYAYEWHTDSFQFSKRTTTLPVISSAQNGSGATLTTEAHYNSRGLLIKSVDERGTVTEYAYDELRGARISMKQDVGTGRENLVTDYIIDDRGRTVLTLGPVHDVDIGGTPTAIRTAQWTYYLDSSDSRWTFSGYRTSNGTPTDHVVGTVLIEQANIAPPSGTSYSGCRQASTVEAVYAGIGVPGPSHTFARSTWRRWSISLHNASSQLQEERTYFNIPADGYGTRSVNYARTVYGYDTVGRMNEVTDADDNVDKTSYNSMGWPVKSESGTVLGSLVTISESTYDDSGNLVQAVLPVNSTSADSRVTQYTYDWRNRRTQQTVEFEKDGSGTWTVLTKFTYDNLNRATEVTGYHTSESDSNRISHRVTEYDDLSRPYRTTVRGVAANGDLTGSLVSNVYYDKTGRVARDAPAGSRLFTTTVYDRLGRMELVSRAYEPSSSSSSGSASSTSSDPASLANAIVMAQQQFVWDQAGNQISTTSLERFDNASGNGDLKTPTTEPKARVSYTASYPDPIGRVMAVAVYGTNGGASWSRSETVPGRSDDVLVTTTNFNEVGEGIDIADPAGIVTSQTFDAAGRRKTVVENATGAASQRRTTRYEYTAAGALMKLISDNPSTGQQVTEWVRGVTTGQGSAINSNRLVFQKIFPGGGSDKVTFTYNRQQQVISMSDQAAILHSYLFNKLGSMIGDIVTFPSTTSLDTTVGRIMTGYNERGLAVRTTSLNAAGTVVVNEVLRFYNDFNQVITEYQEHSGAVNTSTSLKVEYTYANGTASSNTVRPTGVKSPSAISIATAYSSSQADALSRPDQIKEGTNVLASMKFLGLGTLVELNLDGASNALWTMKNGSTGSGGDVYSGIDRFGRLVESIWKTSSSELVHTKYARNRVGGIMWQENVKAHATSVATQDNYYWYDGLQQVTRHDRGDLAPGSGPPFTGIVVDTRKQQELFGFDETGNWNTENAQSPALAQSRTHNQANQITSLSGPTGVVQPQYDPAGNMILMPATDDWTKGKELQWDAWNRLVRIKNPSSSSSSSESSSSSDSSSESGSNSGSDSSSSSSASAITEITFQYDGSSRRTRKTNDLGTIDYYYDQQWRAIEERSSGAVVAHYVWSPLDRWTMIRRKRSVSGTLDETRYVLKDYLDPVAIIDTDATVIERFGYDAFGPVQFMAADFTPRTTSQAGWNFLFHAEFLDTDSGLYNYGYRYYDPQLGRWISRDPIGEEGGINLYCFVDNNSLDYVDLLGLKCCGGVEYEESKSCCEDGRLEEKEKQESGIMCCPSEFKRQLKAKLDEIDQMGIPVHLISPQLRENLDMRYPCVAARQRFQDANDSLNTFERMYAVLLSTQAAAICQAAGVCKGITEGLKYVKPLMGW